MCEFVANASRLRSNQIFVLCARENVRTLSLSVRLIPTRAPYHGLRFFMQAT
jgi:hypothetical protein